MDAVRDHGDVQGIPSAAPARPRSRSSTTGTAVGVNLPAIFDELETDGVAKFISAWQNLLDNLTAAPPRHARRGRTGLTPAWHRPTSWGQPAALQRGPPAARIAGPCSVVIFGVTGDLSKRKLMPAIYDLANRGLLPPSFALGLRPPRLGRPGLRQGGPRRGPRARPHGVPRGRLEPVVEGFPVRGRRVHRRRRVRPARGHPGRARRGPRDWRQPRLLPEHPAALLLCGGQAAHAQRALPQRRGCLAPGGGREALRP